MQLLDLPLDCFRYILTFIARDFDFHEQGHEFLRLRLINRTMDTEVLRALQRPAFYLWKRKTRTLETGPFFIQWTTSAPSAKKFVPISSGYLDFFASFLLLRPHAQEPWNGNISSVLNHVVDALLSADGLDTNDGTRNTTMRDLCHRVFEMKQWKACPGCFTDSLFPRPQSKYANESESVDFNVLLANLLLGRRSAFADQDISTLMARKSIVFGTLLQACIMGGQVEQVTHLLNRGVDVNDESLAILETAIASDRPEMLDLLFSPKYNLSRSMTAPSRIERAIQRAVQTDKTEAILYLARTCDVSAIPKEISFAFGHACCHNNFRITGALFDELKVVLPCSEGQLEWVLAHVVFNGHQDMVRFLLDRGFACGGVKMMYAAACSGDISMARFLLRECEITLTAGEWCNVLREAVIRVTPRYQAFVEAVLSDPSIFEKQSVSAESIFQGRSSDHAELLIQACKHGNVFVVRKLAEAGAELNHAESASKIPPVLVAHIAGQTAVADLLVEMGAKPIHPLESEYKAMFERGELPRPEKKKPVSSDDCYWWM